MFESIRQTVNLLVEQELDKKREELIQTARPGFESKNQFNLLDIDYKQFKNIDNTSVSIRLIDALMPTPHISYSTLHYEDDPEDGSFKTIAWVNKDLNSGLVMCETDEDEFEVSSFKVHKRGKHGRGVAGNTLYSPEKQFLEHLDNFVAEVILLGLDETSTESKE
jgi:hypothetical protein